MIIGKERNMENMAIEVKRTSKDGKKTTNPSLEVMTMTMMLGGKIKNKMKKLTTMKIKSLVETIMITGKRRERNGKNKIMENSLTECLAYLTLSKTLNFNSKSC